VERPKVSVVNETITTTTVVEVKEPTVVKSDAVVQVTETITVNVTKPIV